VTQVTVLFDDPVEAPQLLSYCKSTSELLLKHHSCSVTVKSTTTAQLLLEHHRLTVRAPDCSVTVRAPQLLSYC